eukprot:13898923-Alexandrium_andersonii.AAC.1
MPACVRQARPRSSPPLPRRTASARRSHEASTPSRSSGPWRGTAPPPALRSTLAASMAGSPSKHYAGRRQGQGW